MLTTDGSGAARESIDRQLADVEYGWGQSPDAIAEADAFAAAMGGDVSG